MNTYLLSLLLLASTACYAQTTASFNGSGAYGGTATYLVPGTGGGIIPPPPPPPLVGVPPTFFGLHINNRSNPWPTVPFGALRLWDAGVAWPFINTSAGVFKWTAASGGGTGLDDYLQLAKTHNVDVLYGLTRTPGWAAANADAASFCQYDNSPSGNHGECYLPSDLAVGTTNTIWVNWISAIAAHIASLNGATYQKNLIFEPGNETTVNTGFRMSDSGGSHICDGTLTPNPCWNYGDLAQITIDTSRYVKAVLAAQVTSPDTVNWIPPGAKGVATAQQSIFAATPTLSAGNGARTVANSVDAISFHSYMGTGNAEELFNMVAEINADVPSSSSYALYDTEFSWGTNAPQVTDEDLRAAYLARMYLVGFSAGIARMYWYGWDFANDTGRTGLWYSTTDGGRCTVASAGGGYLCKAGVAYQQIYNWMVGNTLAVPCSGPMPHLGGVSSYGLWSCTFLKPDGTMLKVVWNTSNCMSSTLASCTTVSYTVPVNGTGYYTLDNSTLTATTAGTVLTLGPKPIGIVLAGGPALPSVWVDSHECDPGGGTYNATKTIPGDYAATPAGLNQALTDWAAAADQSWHIVVTAGTVISGPGIGGAALITVPVKAAATKCAVVDSSSPLTVGRTVCSHGIQDSGLTPSLPDGGTRNPGCSSPNDTTSMYTLEETTNNPVIEFLSGSNHVLFQNVEIREASSYSSENTGLVMMGHNDSTQTMASQAPAHIGIDRAYIHGYDSPETHIRNAINWHCAYCWITNTYIDQIKDRTFASESHALAESNAVGPVKIVHNWIEGGSSGIFTGGSTPLIGTYGTDFEIRRNRVTLDMAYCPTGGVSAGVNVKNRLELKEAARVVIDGNIFENNCVDSQAGSIFLVNVRACSSGVACDNYTSTVKDVTVTNNILRHTWSGMNNDGDTGGAAAGISVGVGGQNWAFTNNLFYDHGNYTLYGNAGGVNATTFAFSNGSTGYKWTNCSGSGDGTTATLVCADPGTGAHQTDMQPGDPVAVTACSNTAFNTTPTGGLGPPALAGTLPAGLTVVYASSGTGAVTGCSLSNQQGWPKWQTYSHNTYISTQQGSTPANKGCQGPSDAWRNAHAISNTFIDSLFLVESTRTPSSYGWFCNAHSEGTSSEQAGWDIATLVAHHLVFSGAVNTKYTEYGGPNSGANPPVNMWFPSKIECSAGTVSGSSPTCVGLVGLMSGTAVNMNLADYHGYALDASSPYKAGGANQASDGTDLGVDLTKLDTAQSRTTYPGGFAD